MCLLYFGIKVDCCKLLKWPLLIVEMEMVRDGMGFDNLSPIPNDKMRF